VHDHTLRQTAVSGDMLARADAGIRLFGQLGTLAGAAVGGVAGDLWGARTVLAMAAALLGLAAIVALAWLPRAVRHAQTYSPSPSPSPLP
jgi:predicted MFS family arabinose efflux permease